jgi:threonine/homoserine/homoserine lactone efflux protein
MPDGAHLAAFAAAAAVLAVLPGAGMLYVLARSLADGRRAGVRSSLGTAVGGLCHVLAAAVGLSALLMTSATAFVLVRYAGALYLVALGVRTLVARGAEPAPRAAPRAFRQGVLTELMNPKTALFFLTFLPQFVQPAHGPALLQLLVLGCASVSLNSGRTSSWHPPQVAWASACGRTAAGGAASASPRAAR